MTASRTKIRKPSECMEILEKRFFKGVRYMLNFEPDKKKMPELFSKRSGRLYGKVYNKSEKTSINTRKKEIDIGKSDKKITELLFKNLI